MRRVGMASAVMMTAVVTALVLLPLAIAGGAAGREIEGQTAMIILRGLDPTAIGLLALSANAIDG